MITKLSVLDKNITKGVIPFQSRWLQQDEQLPSPVIIDTVQNIQSGQQEQQYTEDVTDTSEFLATNININVNRDFISKYIQSKTDIFKHSQYLKTLQQTVPDQYGNIMLLGSLCVSVHTDKDNRGKRHVPQYYTLDQSVEQTESQDSCSGDVQTQKQNMDHRLLIYDGCTSCISCQQIWRLQQRLQQQHLWTIAMKDCLLYAESAASRLWRQTLDTRIKKYLSDTKTSSNAGCAYTYKVLDPQYRYKQFYRALRLLHQYKATVALWNYISVLGKVKHKLMSTTQDPSGVLLQMSKAIKNCSQQQNNTDNNYPGSPGGNGNQKPPMLKATLNIYVQIQEGQTFQVLNSIKVDEPDTPGKPGVDTGAPDYIIQNIPLSSSDAIDEDASSNDIVDVTSTTKLKSAKSPSYNNGSTQQTPQQSLQQSLQESKKPKRDVIMFISHYIQAYMYTVATDQYKAATAINVSYINGSEDIEKSKSKSKQNQNRNNKIKISIQFDNLPADQLQLIISCKLLPVLDWGNAGYYNSPSSLDASNYTETRLKSTQFKPQFLDRMNRWCVKMQWQQKFKSNNSNKEQEGDIQTYYFQTPCLCRFPG